jgi:twitching motility protein PilT
MARIDSILSILDRQGANELRIGSDKEPQMFADGMQKKLTMPKTSTETLRELLGDLLPADREQLIAAQGEVQFVYDSLSLGPFRVTMTRRSASGAPLLLDIKFLKGRGKAAAEPAAPAPMVSAPVASAPMVSAPMASAPVASAPTASASVETSKDAATPELAALLSRAAALRASDVHLLEGDVPLMRVDGKLRPLVGEGPASLPRLFGAPRMAEIERKIAARTSVDLAIGVPGVGRFRLNVFQSSAGLAAALRILPASPPSLAELRLPMPLDDLVDLPHGLVVVCGATGSGKSTTLAALVSDALARRPSMVITLEDPIEYTLGRPGMAGAVRQRQVGRDVVDFASGLRDALREDPDILLIGEMRDPETVSLALTAAETGHLVLASLHSRSAASAIERIVDTYPAARQQQIRVQLADALRVVVAQRLVPYAGGDGRVVALEVLRVNHAVAASIREARTGSIQSAIQAGRREGMIPLERCLADLVQRRAISVADARAVANDPTALSSYLSG